MLKTARRCVNEVRAQTQLILTVRAGRKVNEKRQLESIPSPIIRKTFGLKSDPDVRIESGKELGEGIRFCAGFKGRPANIVSKIAVGELPLHARGGGTIVLKFTGLNYVITVPGGRVQS